MTSPGKLQVNLFSPFEQFEYPFLDFIKQSAGGFKTNNLQPVTDQWTQVNDDGYPQSGTGWNGGVNVYFRSNSDILVIQWNSATNTFTLNSPAAGFTLTEITANRTSTRREYNLVNNSASFGDSCAIQVSSSGTIDNTLSQIQVFYKTFEATLNSGEVFDPNFIARYQNVGRMRFMDWMGTNTSMAACWGDRVQQSAQQWFGMSLKAKNYCSYLLRDGGNDMSCSVGPSGWIDNNGSAISSPSSWVDGQMVQYVPRYIQISGSTNVSNPSFTAAGHPLTTGDAVMAVSFGGSWAGPYNGRYFDVTVVDANTVQLSDIVTGAPIDGTSLGTFSGTFANLAPTPRSLTVASFSNDASAPKIITTSTHNFSVGDIITFPGNNTGTFSSRTTINLYKVAALDGVDPTHAFTISNADGTGVNSTTWGTYVANSAIVSKQIRFKCGALPYRPILTVNMENAAATAVVSFGSFGNNHWNISQLTYCAAADALICQSRDTGSIRYSCNYEMLIKLANECNTNPWFCLPLRATDDFVTRFATLVKNNLNTSLVPCFELSNEVWNTGLGFNQTFQAERLSALTWPIQGTQFGDAAQYYGMRFYQVMALVDAVFAGSSRSYKRIFGIISVNLGASGNDNRFKASLATTGGQISDVPVKKCDSLCVAPYVGPASTSIPALQQAWNYTYGNQSQKAAAIAYLRAQFDDDGTGTGTFTFKNFRNIYYAFYAAQAARASGFTDHSISLCMYEGGLGYNLNQVAGYPGSFDGGDGRGALAITVAQKNQMMFDFFRSTEWAQDFARSYYHDFIANGGEYPSFYATVNNWGNVSSTGQFNLFSQISPNGFGTQTELWKWGRLFDQGKRRLVVKT